MEIILEYLPIVLWISPFYFFLMSYLHYKKKGNLGAITGYSAKGQFVVGVAFIFCATALTLVSEWYNVALMLMYLITLIYGSILELNAKSKLVKK